MKTLLSSFASVLVTTFSLSAQEPKDPAPAATSAPAAPIAAETKPAESTAKKSDGPSQEELEAKFKDTLTNAVMSGRFSVVKDGKSQAEQEDKYTIVGVTKLFGENWLVRARIQYGKRDVTVPVPVKVKWAGDTPVITVDGFGLPGGGTAYSARVLVYGDAYAGTWSAGDHGGLMSGVILHEKP